MADDDHDPLSWIARYLGAVPLDRGGDLLGVVAIDEGARWRVEEGEGRFAVLREGGGGEPDAVFEDRQIAYVAAAVFTAFGGPLLPREDLVGDPSGEPAAGEVREPAAAWEGTDREGADRELPSFDEATASRLLSALMRNPTALELLLEAADPETLERARALLVERMIQRGGGQVH